MKRARPNRAEQPVRVRRTLRSAALAEERQRQAESGAGFPLERLPNEILARCIDCSPYRTWRALVFVSKRMRALVECAVNQRVNAFLNQDKHKINAELAKIPGVCPLLGENQRRGKYARERALLAAALTGTTFLLHRASVKGAQVCLSRDEAKRMVCVAMFGAPFEVAMDIVSGHCVLRRLSIDNRKQAMVCAVTSERDLELAKAVYSACSPEERDKLVESCFTLFAYLRWVDSRLEKDQPGKEFFERMKVRAKEFEEYMKRVYD